MLVIWVINEISKVVIIDSVSNNDSFIYKHKEPFDVWTKIVY